MLDQPTQAYYPSEVSKVSGVPDNDEDRLAVRRLYELIAAVVAELNGEFQVIVCDHANLDEDWFQGAIVENWRAGGQLVPSEWVDRARREEPALVTHNHPPFGPNRSQHCTVRLPP